MDRLTTELGKAFLDFEETVCSAYATHELPREVAARQKRQQTKAATSKEGESHTDTEHTKESSTESKPLFKALNLQKYKHHSLGDYVGNIRQYGTTDSYSTQPVCVSHYYFGDNRPDVLYRVSSSTVTPKLDTVGPIERHLSSS